ncbi:MAG TPA: thermonuclease family protein [Kofleriaceae bacterium]|nr:thermonuclease family protein [Kofleriaceae bacterium]
MARTSRTSRASHTSRASRTAGAVVFALGLATALAACSDEAASCGPREATVERVIDGDTIVLPGGLKVRYLLVDTPEATDGHAECYGANAARFNADLVLGKTVQLTYDVQCEDRFGRTIAYVTVGGQDVSRLLIERGYACVLHIPPDGDARADELAALQAEARAAGRGLWGACDPIPCR